MFHHKRRFLLARSQVLTYMITGTWGSNSIWESPSTRCRACSTAEHTATNIVQAPIVRAHRAPRAPCSSCLCSPLLLFAPALCSCSLLLLPLLLLPLLLLLTLLPLLPALRSCLHCLLSRSCSLRSQLPFRLWRCSQTFPSTTCARYSIFRLCFSALSLVPWTLPLLV